VVSAAGDLRESLAAPARGRYCREVTFSPKTSAVAVLAAVLTVSVAGAASAGPAKRVHGFRQFQSPSKNIGCEITKSIARCDIKHRTWSPPPAPSSCQLDWGQGLEVDRHGKGHFVCAGDTALDPTAPKLAYGHVLRDGIIRCKSKTTGMTCRNTRTGHGFTLSKESYRRF
jgi:hypothetical protein